MKRSSCILIVRHLLDPKLGLQFVSGRRRFVPRMKLIFGIRILYHKIEPDPKLKAQVRLEQVFIHAATVLMILCIFGYLEGLAFGFM